MCLLFPPAFRAWYYIRVRPAYHACVLALFASHPATLSAHQSESRAASIHLLPIHWAHHTPRRPPASARKKEDAVTTGGVGSISAPNGRRIIYPGVGGDLPAAVALRPRRAPPLRRRMRKKDRDLPAGPAISGTGHAHSGGWEKAGGVQRAHTHAGGWEKARRRAESTRQPRRGTEDVSSLEAGCGRPCSPHPARDAVPFWWLSQVTLLPLRRFTVLPPRPRVSSSCARDSAEQPSIVVSRRKNQTLPCSLSLMFCSSIPFHLRCFFLFLYASTYDLTYNKQHDYDALCYATALHLCPTGH
ncbi:hypothetical protein SEVIR_5G439366v4 [Setaria viridis]|nr:uncharacterized protein LOC117855893 [Setaria viridis]XP_034594181.1 uncharacterized protein LOC117855893 [Setaria viridis]XP_034594182.1 uncharacterized protein LOC117855893 [Setaria viridis]